MTRKFLLLTDIPPNQQMTGGLFLNEMARLLPEGALAVFATLHPFLPEVELSPDIGSVPYQTVDALYARPKIKRIRQRVGKRAGAAASYILETWVERVYLPGIVRQATEFGRSVDAEAVWTVLQSPLMFRLAHRVAKALDVPLYSFVMDPPDWWLEYNAFDRFSRRMVTHEFETSLRDSAAVGCGSWNMAEEYHRLYGSRTVAIVPSLPETASRPPAQAPKHAERFVIGFAGQLYAQVEWQALIHALDKVNWHISGRKIIIRLMGDINLISSANTPNVPVNIEMLGWRPQSEVISLLADSDACYVPYRFTDTHKNEARLAFPSKLTTYLTTGRPVFFHGPDYSSPGQFLAEHDAAVLSHSLEADDILNSLETLVADEARYAQLTANGARAFKNKLTLETQRRSVAEFLDVPLEELRSLETFIQPQTT